MDSSAVQKSLEEIAAKAVSDALGGGASEAEAGVSYEEGLTVTVRLGELESVERQRDRSLAVTVYRDRRKGSASTADFSPEAVERTVRKALSIAGFTAPDEYAGLADASSMATTVPDLDLYHPWELDVETATVLARRAEDTARGHDVRVTNSEGASISSSHGVRAYANSHGFCSAYASSSHAGSCSVVAGEDGALERDYWYTAARSPQGLEAPEQVGRQAAVRALRRLGARQLSTRVLPVVFPAELARGLFGHLIAAIRGTSQYRRASFLLNAAGEQIFPQFVQIEEDPHVPQAMASAPFDSEGVGTRPRTLVDRGVLKGYVLSSYSARRLGLQTTGNAGGVHNLIVRPTTESFESLWREYPEVFVVGELLGQGVNTVTGDYSRGAAGFLYERGELVHAVSEVTIAGNLRNLFRNIRAIGPDVDLRGAVRCGSVLVEGLTLAGQ